MFVANACVPLLVMAIATSATTPRVAVVDAQVEGESTTQVEEALTSGLVRGLAGAGLESIAAGQSCRDTDCVAAVAERSGAPWVARALVRVSGTDYEFTLELLDAQTGTTLQTRKGSCEICTYEEAAEALFEEAERFEVPDVAPEPSHLRLSIRSQPTGATVHVDGAVVGTTPMELELDPAEHELTLTKGGYEPVTRWIGADVDGEELEFDLLRTQKRTGKLGYAGWAVAGTGLASLVSGIVLIGINEREVKSNCSGENVDAAGNCQFRYDTLAGGVTMTVLGALGVGVGAGLVIWERKHRSSNVTAGLGFDGLRIQGRF